MFSDVRAEVDTPPEWHNAAYGIRMCHEPQRRIRTSGADARGPGGHDVSAHVLERRGRSPHGAPLCAYYPTPRPYVSCLGAKAGTSGTTGSSHSGEIPEVAHGAPHSAYHPTPRPYASCLGAIAGTSGTAGGSHCGEIPEGEKGVEKGLRARHATAQPNEGGRAAGCPGYTARDAQTMIPGRRPPGAVARPSFGSPPAVVGAGFGSASVGPVLGVGVVTVAPDCPLARLCGTAGACPMVGAT